eukprot:GHUV01007553.1.p1 GENE.GHUV01007553.1~~GHUV01007553.1.p1  ORF type:complete len:338 (+),score=81.02 GHUV01007553.1:294-1307(+)
MRGGIRRLFGCASAPQEVWVPDIDNPLPDSFFQGGAWSPNRQKALERQLTNASGAVTVIGRDSAALVNISCDRDYSERSAADGSRPQTAPHRGTFKRLESVPNRVSSAPLTDSDHTSTNGEQPQQQQLNSRAVLAAAAAAAVQAAAPARAQNLQWTESRRMLETNLVLEQAVTKLQQGPDYLSEQQRLDQRLMRLNLVVQFSYGDGNCQFRSVSEQLYGTQEHHAFVRQIAVDHIRHHPEEYQAFLGEDFHYYCAGMAQLGTWGDELTLRAVCDSFGVVVHVVTSEQHNWYLRYNPLKLKSTVEVFLTYIAPIHYNSLRRQKTQRSFSLRLPSVRSA